MICVTPPLELALTAYALGLLWRVPFAPVDQRSGSGCGDSTGHVQKSLGDLPWPESWRRFAYNRAARLIVLSDGFADNISRKGSARHKIEVVSGLGEYRIHPSGNFSGKLFGRKNGIDPAAFVVLHAGNIGNKQRLELLIQAAKHVEAHGDIQFVIVGDGARKQAVVAEAKRLGAE